MARPELTSILSLVQELSRRPHCYERRGSLFWKEPWTSRKALDVQLDSENGEGARSREVARAQVEELFAYLHGAPNSVLDLGSGPGFHLTAFAQAGSRVRGVDISPAAMEYARGEVAAESEEVRNRIVLEEGDLLDRKWETGAFDLILFLFGEYCLLTDSERADLLGKARGALAPGGKLVLELFDQPLDEVIHEQSWEYIPGDGFWMEAPYLELATTEVYEEEAAILHRFYILSEETVREERIWETSMNEKRLREEASKAGLEVLDLLWDHPLFDGGGTEEGRRWVLAILE